ncbi:MAG: glycosyl hydrolase family 18 protein, partial [Chloroflexota bacterium]
MSNIAPVDPARAAGIENRVGKVRWGYYVPYAANSFDSLKANVDALNYLSPYWYQIDAAGNLIASGAEVGERNKEAVVQLARSKGVKVLPMIKNSSTYAAFTPVLAEGAVRRKAVDRIVQEVQANNFDGIHIDFEGINAEDRAALTAFMADLAPRLRQAGRLVTQAVPAKDQERFTGWAGAYDYAALAPHNDLIVLMTYGYGTGVPQSTAPYPWVERSAAYAAGLVPANKLLLGLAWYGYDWNLTGGGVTALRHPEAVNLAVSNKAAVQFDSTVQTPHFTYDAASGEKHEVWFEDTRSNDAKMDLVFRYGLAGAAGWRMGHEDGGVWPLFRDRLGFRTWFLAEGATTPPYDTWILIQNPNPEPVTASVTFLKEAGAPVTVQYDLKPSSRFSIYANQVVPNSAFSTKI